ncbi:MAG TPA: Gingipain R, partial [Candidatus Cloacimonadota bacterium]|nr:Gingipain R [Candidatus Cloacimonadota bacterium]
YVDVPDQHVATFTFTVTDGTNIWSSNRSLTINAPNMTVTTASIFDPSGNGVFEPGETIGVTINVANTGNMPVESGTLRLILNSPYASLINDLFFIPGLANGGLIPISFDVNLAGTIPEGTVIPVGIALDMGIQMINHSVMIPVGAVMEGFESGDFTTFPWVNSSAIPWSVVSNDLHSGNYSARSGAISHYGNTTLQITMNVGAAGDIKFSRKVSSESGYDFLKFYIDNVEKGAWSGTQNWAEMTYAVTPGMRTFKWTYSKDQSDIPPIGSDCAWIDDITFPSIGEGNLALIYSPTQSINFQSVMPNTTVTQDFTLRNLGNVSLSGMISIPQEFTLS